MSMPPPVYRAPMTRPNPSSGVPPGLVVLLGLIFGGGLLGLILLASFLIVKGKKPSERAGIHQPVSSRRLGNGWSWYRLEPIHMYFASTVPPKPLTFNPENVKRFTNVTQYGGYIFRGRHVSTRIFAYWMSKSSTSIAGYATRMEKRMQVEIPGIERTSQSAVVVGGYPGRLITCEWDSKGKPCITKTAVVGIGKIQYYIEGTYYKNSDNWSSRAFDYSLRSARFN